jgi:hypothetical protein
MIRRLMIRASAPSRFAALAAFGLWASGGAPLEAQAQQILQGAVAPAPATSTAQARPQRNAAPFHPPEPPRRPADLRAQDVDAQDANARDAGRRNADHNAAERTGTTPPTNRPLLAPLAPAPSPAPAPAPPTPLADPKERAVLRACAEDWRRLQASGEADALLWREFSAECLARGGAPRSRPQAQAPRTGATGDP